MIEASETKEVATYTFVFDDIRRPFDIDGQVAGLRCRREAAYFQYFTAAVSGPTLDLLIDRAQVDAFWRAFVNDMVPAAMAAVDSGTVPLADPSHAYALTIDPAVAADQVEPGSQRPQEGDLIGEIEGP